MLKIKPYKQKPGYCGPASLKMVLNYFGVYKTELELAKLSHCTKENGVEAKPLLKAAQKLGFDGFVKDFSDISDLKKYVIQKKIPVIVDWFSTDDGHYSVVTHIDSKKIHLMDPEHGKKRTLTLETFKRVWFDFPNGFLKSKNELNVRRMIVIYPKKRK